MDVPWLMAVIDLPAERFEVGATFWQLATNSTRGNVEPDYPEFVHLIPADGTMHLELQRIEAGVAGAHLDIVVTDIPAWTERARSLGAEVISQPGHSVLRSPGGIVFCVVPHDGSTPHAAPAIDAALPHAVDQLCLDVPHSLFDAELVFWSALLDWSVNPARMPEFRSFDQPNGLAIRLLVQQLGVDDTAGARSHLDVACGIHVEALVAKHVALGAEVRSVHERWTAMRGPAGVDYCLTRRELRN